MLIATIFLATAILKLVINITSLSTYETGFLENAQMNRYVAKSSLENKLFLFFSMLIAAGCLFGKLKKTTDVSKPTISTQKIYRICMALALIAGCLLIAQYGYREFRLKTGLAMIAALLVLVMMAVDSIKKTNDTESLLRFQLLNVIVVVFSCVTMAKAVIWQASLQKLNASLLKSPSSCTELGTDNFKWVEKNPYKIIKGWALPTLALIEQNTHPRKLLLKPGNCSTFYQTGIANFDDWTSIPKSLITPSVK
jgi:glucan phosphoethanolaminetransferase (alkaline phosphatase superfamily)